MPKKKATKKEDKGALQVNGDPIASRDANIARAALTPTVQAAGTTQLFKIFSNETTDFGALVDELNSQVKTVQEGELDRPEAMLVAQAHTLDAIFNNLARRSASNMGEYTDAAETYMKLALRAQSQCRSTIEALSEIKNPRHVAFVKQANIAHNQQVNNGSRAEENEIAPNELLEKNDGERLECGATSAAISDGEAVATVGTRDRAENTRRKSQGKSQR
jgi:hypothetical protein